MPTHVLPPQHELTEAFIKSALASLSAETVVGQTKWGSCELIALLWSIREVLGPERDKDKFVAPVIALYCRTASALHLHLLLRLFTSRAAAVLPAPSLSSPQPAAASSHAISSLATPDDIVSLAYMLGACVGTCTNPSQRIGTDPICSGAHLNTHSLSTSAPSGRGAADLPLYPSRCVAIRIR